MSDWISKIIEDDRRAREQETDRQDERDRQAERNDLLRDFSDNPDALAAYYGVDVDCRPHDRVMDQIGIVSELIWDCSAIPEELRESFWEDLQDLDTESVHAVENIKEFARQLLEFADETNPDLKPILAALMDAIAYARLMF